MNDVTVPKRISVTSSGRSRESGECKMTIEGLQDYEMDAIKSMLLGLNWISTGDSGRIISIPAKTPLPPPTDDEMLPFWREHPLSDGIPVIQQEIFDPESLKRNNQSSIYIQSLCGYYYTKDSYRSQAEKLTRWGFECLRSRRGENGQYWELWYLSGIWAAKEELRDAIGSKHPDYETRKGEEFDQMLNFLSKNVQFGTLDASVQKLAMIMAD